MTHSVSGERTIWDIPMNSLFPLVLEFYRKGEIYTHICVTRLLSVKKLGSLGGVSILDL